MTCTAFRRRLRKSRHFWPTQTTAPTRPGRSAAGVAPLRRALGPPLAGRRALRRIARLRQGQAATERLALSRLRHRQLERGQAVRPVRRRADCRRRAVSRRSAGRDGDRVSSRPDRGISSATSSCAKGRSTRISPARTIATTWWPARCRRFVSLTVHCARCHDHKFDPIRQEDYYALQAVFAGVDRADRPYDA